MNQPLQVNYKVTIGSTNYTVGNSSSVLKLRVSSSLNIPVNLCQMSLSITDSLSLSVDESLTVNLGNNSELIQVFQGKISQISWKIDQVHIEAISSFTTLTRAKFNLLYEKSFAGDIVKNIAQNRLNIKVEKVENGIKFPVYVIGDSQTVYENLHNLAQQCGFDLYANIEDKLVFAPYKAEKNHEFNYGVNILAWEQLQENPYLTGVEIYGESPASQGEGEQATSWLTKKAVKGSDGKQTPESLRLSDPSARNQDIAKQIAKAYLAIHQKKQRGIIKVVGDSKVKLGDGVKIAKMPISSLNGTFKIASVAHYLSRRQGFYTTINWEEI
jgi:hypothetical protein